MHQKNLGIIIVLLFLSIKNFNFQDVNKDDISFNYEFDYQSNVEAKNSSGHYISLISYVGKIETSAYILTDKQELLLLKFNVYGTGKHLNETSSITSLVIRQNGLVEKIIIDESSPLGLLNLLKGIVNLLNLNEMREDKIEPDISGECFVKYESINDQLLRKAKTQCNNTIVLTPTETKVDSFSLYKESIIDIYYSYNIDGALISIKSVETHSLEPVLFHDLIQDYKSTTMITFKKLTKSRSMISSVTLENVIRIIFGNNYREVFLVSTPEFLTIETKNNEKLSDQIKLLLDSNKKKPQITVELINIFRQITKISILKEIMKTEFSISNVELLHDAIIGCNTKLCSEIFLNEISKYIKENESEAHRMLLLLQNIRSPGNFLLKNLWIKIKNSSHELYDQGIQTIASLIGNSQNNSNLKAITNDFVDYIKNRISQCPDDFCLLVHLNAIKNSRIENFENVLYNFIEKSGNYSSKTVAHVFNTFWILKFSEKNEIVNKENLFKLVKSKINFFDPFVQYQSINCLVMLQIDTVKLIEILNELQINNSHFQFFLMKKLRELINFGIIKDSVTLLQSKFFTNSKYLFLTYSEQEGSKVLVKPLFASENSLIDIHFNIIGSDGGLIKHSMTDLFLVSTAQENNIFSLATHMTGLQSFMGQNEEENQEEVEGLLQLSLLGKATKPVKLFHGTTDLMSALWNAPSNLKSILRGSFVPIDSKYEILFQNGIVLMSEYIGSIYLDFSFQLNSNLWYKTAYTFLKTTGNAYVKIQSKFKSIDQTIDTIKDLSLDTGIDFETNIDYGSTPMKTCLTILRPTSKMHTTSVIISHNNSSIVDHSNKFLNVFGQCYSITQKMNELCSEF